MKATPAVLIDVAFTLDACNTVEGAGKDLETGGETVQETGSKVRKAM